ncbi:hypothetical protein H1230_18790 [Paenibacillus sp. 19GGS1-52]|uniref:hypothetical protein n=1 Tax=Paenibacillus sp. 19GGS1-52 TaxID=2758563 RepID=UPI001EFA2D8A|nr:hypothetical protein [Paenibacillus sp. 19GGS1-52]ULO05158.1 hypothetical protein H1230_18790 [Paenibacillus sp. 19GGS1-52]
MTGKAYELLGQQVFDFTRSVDARSRKINSKLQELNVKSDAIRVKINENAAELVDLEISGDSAGSARLQKSNRQLRLELDEISDQIAGYQAQLSKGSQHEKELEKIRSTVQKATAERIENYNRMTEERDAIREQIKVLQSKANDINNRLPSANVDSEYNQLLPLLDYIDPRITQLSYNEKNELVRRWADGRSIDIYFDSPTSSEYKGPKITYNNLNEVEYTPPIMGGLGVPGHFQDN